MAKAFGKDPTANLFTLLPPDEGDVPSKIEKKKPVDKSKKNTETEKVAVKPSTNVALTPAAKAAARKAKEAKDKEVKIAPPEKKDDKQPVKLNREQWEQQIKRTHRKKDNGGEVTNTVNQNDAPQQVEFGGRGGPGPDGRRGRGRGGRDGRRGRGGRSRVEENKNREFNQRGQNLSEGKQGPRGREYDRRSGMKTSKFPPTKRRGGGQRNWGENPTAFNNNNNNNPNWEVEENTETTNENPAVTGESNAPVEAVVEGSWGDDDQNKETTTTTSAPTTEESDQQPSAETDEKLKVTNKGLDDFLKEQSEKQAELAAHLNRNVEPRIVIVEEGVVLKESNKNEKVSKPADEQKMKKNKIDKASKFVDISKVFDVKTLPPPSRGRGNRWGDEEYESRSSQQREDRPPRGRGGRRGRGGQQSRGNGGQQSRGNGRGSQQSRGGGGGGRQTAILQDQDFPSLGST